MYELCCTLREATGCLHVFVPIKKIYYRHRLFSSKHFDFFCPSPGPGKKKVNCCSPTATGHGLIGSCMWRHVTLENTTFRTLPRPRRPCSCLVVSRESHTPGAWLCTHTHTQLQQLVLTANMWCWWEPCDPQQGLVWKIQLTCSNSPKRCFSHFRRNLSREDICLASRPRKTRWISEISSVNSHWSI